MKARLVFHEKRLLWAPATAMAGLAELRVWEVPKSSDYPSGRKFSLFLITEGTVLLGIDNHRPKGPHLHLGDRQVPFRYESDDQLLRDFWELVRKAGFEP
jgi:hypothetical protein